MSRFTERDAEGRAYWNVKNGVSWSDIIYGNAIDKLCAYEDAEEQGRLIVLPCKVGDTVYFSEYGRYDSAIIEKITVDETGICFEWVQYEYGVDITEVWDDGYFDYDDIGKTVFLTSEEAEAALEKMQEGQK